MARKSKAAAEAERVASGVIRDRIVGHEDVDPASLAANPLNFRRHGEHQRAALRGSLSALGWIKEVLVNKTTGRIIDGHARVEEALAQGAPYIPVTYVELSEEEEKLALAVLDPITELATSDEAALNTLLDQVETDDANLLALMNSLRSEESIATEDVSEHWQGMPEFEHEDKMGVRAIIIHFRTQADVDAFAKLIGQEFTPATKSTWYPTHEIESEADGEYA